MAGRTKPRPRLDHGHSWLRRRILRLELRGLRDSRSDYRRPPLIGPHAADRGDLYLRTLDLADLDEAIVESVRSAVACFCADLYLPAQIMFD